MHTFTSTFTYTSTIFEVQRQQGETESDVHRPDRLNVRDDSRIEHLEAVGKTQTKNIAENGWGIVDLEVVVKAQSKKVTKDGFRYRALESKYQ